MSEFYGNGDKLPAIREGGYKAVCKCCHDKWSAWDSSLRYFGA